MEFPIRILHVVGGMGVGGTETLIMDIYRKVDRSKVQFDFLVNSDKDEFYNKEILSLGGRIFFIEKYKITNWHKYTTKLKEFFFEHAEYKVVHCHLGSVSSVFCGIAKKFNKFVICHSHNTYGNLNIRKIIYRINVFPVRYIADAFFACSYLAGEERFGSYVMRSRKGKVLKNGIDVEKYSPKDDEVDCLKKELCIASDDTVYIHIGRFTEAKNHRFLIDVFSGVYKKNNNSKLLLLGDGALRDEISQRVSELGLDHVIIFVGNVKNVETYLNLADAMIFPSLWEGLGIVLIEAQATGLPCFVSNSIQPEAIINDNVKVLNLEDGADKWIKTILANNYERLSAEKSRDNVRAAGFDIVKVAKDLEEFYLTNCR